VFSWNISFSAVEPFKWHTPDLYIPVFTILEFIAYMGWIKVAEALLNPFGSDDEDLDINYLLDRNFQVRKS
jgi:bestrophin-1